VHAALESCTNNGPTHQRMDRSKTKSKDMKAESYELSNGKTNQFSLE